MLRDLRKDCLRNTRIEMIFGLRGEAETQKGMRVLGIELGIMAEQW